MSYYSEVIKDDPHSLWMLDGTISDSSGNSRVPVVSGSLSTYGPALVNGAKKSSIFSPGIAVSIPFPYAAPGMERQPFSIEAWVVPHGNMPIATHASDMDGLVISGSSVYFSVKLESGLVSVNYTPSVMKKLHLVGVYSGSSLQLYVNGVLEAYYNFSEEQQKEAIDLTVNDNYLTVGSGSAEIQALAIYQYALGQLRITSHFNMGNKAISGEAASRLFGGQYLEMTTRKANIFLTKNWTVNWEGGYSNASLFDEVSSAIDPDTGSYIASFWENGFELETPATTIDGVQIAWDGGGTYFVATSLDGITWSAANNGQRVSGISSGFDPTDKILRIRISFVDGFYGEVTSLSLTGLIDLSISSSTIPISLPAGALISQVKEMNLRDYDTGVQFDGTLSIGPDTAEGAVGFKTISYWYYCPTGSTLSDNFAGTVTYQNGVAVSPTTIKDRWTFVVETRPTLNTSAINFAGTGVKIAYLSLYVNQLTANQAKTVYDAFNGTLIVRGSETANAVSVVDDDATIYSADWSIQPFG